MDQEEPVFEEDRDDIANIDNDEQQEESTENEPKPPMQLHEILEEFEKKKDFSDDAFAGLLKVISRWVHSHPVRGAVERHVTTQDMTNDIFISIWKRIFLIFHMADTPVELAGCLKRVATRRVYSQVRKRYAKKRPQNPMQIDEETVSDMNPFGPEFEVDLEHDYKHTMQKIEEMIDDMAPNDAAKYAMKLRLIKHYTWEKTYGDVVGKYSKQQTPSLYMIKKWCKKIVSHLERDILPDEEDWKYHDDTDYDECDMGGPDKKEDTRNRANSED